MSRHNLLPGKYTALFTVKVPDNKNSGSVYKTKDNILPGKFRKQLSVINIYCLTCSEVKSNPKQVCYICITKSTFYMSIRPFLIRNYSEIYEYHKITYFPCFTRIRVFNMFCKSTWENQLKCFTILIKIYCKGHSKITINRISRIFHKHHPKK